MLPRHSMTRSWSAICAIEGVSVEDRVRRFATEVRAACRSGPDTEREAAIGGKQLGERLAFLNSSGLTRAAAGEGERWLPEPPSIGPTRLIFPGTYSEKLALSDRAKGEACMAPWPGARTE